MDNPFKITSALSSLLMIACASYTYADDETGLGSASGLSGDSTNGAVTSAPQPIRNIPSNARVPIILPPESYQPHTLVVPLPNEKSPPVLLRRDSTEILQPNQPALPRNMVNETHSADSNPTVGKKPKRKPESVTDDSQNTQGQSIKTRPLAPIVY